MSNQDNAQELINVIDNLKYLLSEINHKSVNVKSGQIESVVVGTILVHAYGELNKARDLYLTLPRKYEEVSNV
jgi:hypothetical protein